MCEIVLFRLGNELFGLESYSFLDYRAYRGPYQPVKGTAVPEHYLGYGRWDDGKEFLVDDLRVRFGFMPAHHKSSSGDNLIVFQSREGRRQGFVVDEMTDFCSARTEQTTPWGIDTLLNAEPYRPFVDQWVEASIGRQTVQFWLLRLDDLLLPELQTPL